MNRIFDHEKLEVYRATGLGTLLVWFALVVLPVNGAPPSAAWTLAWGDEFNGTTLDPALWSSGSLPWGGRHHNDQYSSYIMPEDAYVQDGSLWLRCRKAAGNEFGGYPYSEGFVHNNGKRNYTSGYVEIRARFPAGRGVWPAFWTLPQGWPPEFDIAEYFGSDDRMHLGLAYGDSWQNVRWDSTNLYGEAFAGWHTYGLEWGPGYAVWFIDGRPRKSIVASYVPATPMYVILNSGMRWDADSTTPRTNHFEVDYCRLYQLPTTRLNDNSTGSGLNQFNYVGSWSYLANQAGAHLNDNHWSTAAQAYYQIRFSGARVDLYGAKAPNHGIAAVSIDGGAETMVDWYAATRTDRALAWCSPSLAPGTHTLKVRVTGSKNVSSTGTAIPADRLDVWPTSPRLNGAILGTGGSWNDSGNTRTKALDGDLHTAFDAPLASGAWVGLDLGLGFTKRITKIRYCPRPGQAPRMVGGKFQGAQTATFGEATDLFTVTIAPPDGELSDQAPAVTTGFRFVRYLAPAGAYGNVAEIEFHGVDVPPAAPTGLRTTAGDGQVTLTWDAVGGATNYHVGRALARGGPYTRIASTPETSYRDTAVTNEVTYAYVVSAANASGESPPAPEVTATPRPPPALRVDADAGGYALVLSWPGWATDSIPYRATNLARPIAWQPVTNAPQQSAGRWAATLTIADAPAEYFQLRPR